MKHFHNNRGFSLVELMIVVAIIGIITAVAYPSFSNSILKGRRAEARTALAELMQQQERYFTQRNCYVGFSTTTAGVATATAYPSGVCGGTTPAVPFKTFSGDNLAKSAYVMGADTCPSGTSTFTLAECVRVSATPIKADPTAGVLRMTSTGVKDCSSTATGAADSALVCWK